MRNREPLQLIIRLGRAPLEISYGSGPLGSLMIAQKLRAPAAIPAFIVEELEHLREEDLKPHDLRLRRVISEIFRACEEFESVAISYPGGVLWESRREKFPSAA